MKIMWYTFFYEEPVYNKLYANSSSSCLFSFYWLQNIKNTNCCPEKKTDFGIQLIDAGARKMNNWHNEIHEWWDILETKIFIYLLSNQNQRLLD